MITCVVGLDLALSRSGVAIWHRDGEIRTAAVETTGKRGEPWDVRAARIDYAADAVSEYLPADYGGADYVLAVMEGPAYGAAGGSTWDRAGLWWSVARRLYRRGVAVAVVSPPTRALWATGNGRADKAAVASAMTRLTARAYDTSDEADAAALAFMGALWLGWADGPRRKALDAASWPEPWQVGA